MMSDSNPMMGAMPHADKEERLAYQRDWYAKNRDVYRAKNRRLRKRNVDFIATYLREHPCVDCGESDIIVLEFDHVAGDKKGCVTIIAKSHASIARIQREIDKCEVVCANCHRRRTADRCSAHRLSQRKAPLSTG